MGQTEHKSAVKSRLWFGLDKQLSILVLKFNFIFLISSGCGRREYLYQIFTNTISPCWYSRAMPLLRVEAWAQSLAHQQPKHGLAALFPPLFILHPLTPGQPSTNNPQHCFIKRALIIGVFLLITKTDLNSVAGAATHKSPEEHLQRRNNFNFSSKTEPFSFFLIFNGC